MIALDVMGGDHAPHVIVRAALEAAKQSIPLTLFGSDDIILQLLQQYDADWKQYPITIAHAPEQIAMDDDPVTSVRKKTQSSLVQAVLSVKNGQCQAVVSAGSSGALMVAATLLLGRQEGIERPVIAGFLPTSKGKVLGLDLGANTDVRAHHLVQFARLGAEHVARVQGIARPRVALLANGHEASKGSLLIKEAHALLKNSDLNFVGNAEPYHVFEHEMDVIVCDGFAGNILLKTCEAVTDAMSAWYRNGIEAVAQTLSADQAAAVRQAAHTAQTVLDDRLDYKSVGGALLLGVNGTVVVCHGNSDVQTMTHALRFAWDTIKSGNYFQKEICKSVQL